MFCDNSSHKLAVTQAYSRHSRLQWIKLGVQNVARSMQDEFPL